MRRSKYHRYLLNPRHTPAPPLQTSKWQICCKSYSYGLHLGSPTFFQETFFPFFTGWNCSAVSANCDAGSIFLDLLRLAQTGPIVLANCLHRCCPLHSRLQQSCCHCVVPRQPSCGKLKQTFLSYGRTHLLFHKIGLGLCPCLSRSLSASSSHCFGIKPGLYCVPLFAAGRQFLPFSFPFRSWTLSCKVSLLTAIVASPFPCLCLFLCPCPCPCSFLC